MFPCPVVHSNCFSTSFSWSLAASKGSEVSDNDIHALKSICGRLADKESAFRNTTSSNCTALPAYAIPIGMTQRPELI